MPRSCSRSCSSSWRSSSTQPTLSLTKSTSRTPQTRPRSPPAQQLNGGVQGCSSHTSACATQYVAVNNGPSAMAECADGAGADPCLHPPATRASTPNCYQWPYYDKAGNHPQRPGSRVVVRVQSNVLWWHPRDHQVCAVGALGLSGEREPAHVRTNVIPRDSRSRRPQQSTQYSVRHSDHRHHRTGLLRELFSHSDTSCSGGIIYQRQSNSSSLAPVLHIAMGAFQQQQRLPLHNGSTCSYNQNLLLLRRS